MQLFYTPNLTSEAHTFQFNKEESNHIIKVLRKKNGDSLHITNGNGWLFTATITTANAKKCCIDILKKEQKPKPTYHLHLVVAPTKNNDRYEWFLEKATEIGVHEITPIIGENSERKIIKHERYNKIIQAALKQSLRLYMPQLNNAITFKEFLVKNKFANTYIATCEDVPKKRLEQLVKPNENVVILIGPEGDFSQNEITSALDKKYTFITLGTNRLRTETAAILACHTIVALNEISL